MQTNLRTVDAVPITDEIARSVSVSERFDNLLRGPGGGGMFGDVRVQHLTAPMLQHEEHEQDLHHDGRDGKEVDRDHLSGMGVQERLPVLAGHADGALRAYATRCAQR